MFIIHSPLEQFEIHNYIVLKLFNLNLVMMSNLGWFYFFIMLAILIGSKWAIVRKKLIPSKWTIILESLYTTLNNMVTSQITSGSIYFPIIFTLFTFILVSNLIGNIPYSFAITSHLIFTIGMSVAILIGVTIIGFKIHGWEFFSLMVPLGTPLVLVPLLVLIETVSYIARAVSLGLRLGANIMAGHMLLVILGGFIYNILTSSILFFFIGLIPLAIVIGIAGLELAISGIQSYVFAILTCSYIKDAIELH